MALFTRKKFHLGLRHVLPRRHRPGSRSPVAVLDP